MENTPQKLKTNTRNGHIFKRRYIFQGPSFWGPPAVRFVSGCPSGRVLRRLIKSNWDPNALHTSTATQAKIPGVPKDCWDTIEGCRKSLEVRHPRKSWLTETENGFMEPENTLGWGRWFYTPIIWQGDWISRVRLRLKETKHFPEKTKGLGKRGNDPIKMGKKIDSKASSFGFACQFWGVFFQRVFHTWNKIAIRPMAIRFWCLKFLFKNQLGWWQSDLFPWKPYFCR